MDEYPQWVDEAGRHVYYHAPGRVYGTITEEPGPSHTTSYKWSAASGDSGASEGLAAAKRNIELAHDRQYHPEQFHTDREVQAGDAGKGGEK